MSASFAPELPRQDKAQDRVLSFDIYSDHLKKALGLLLSVPRPEEQAIDEGSTSTLIFGQSSMGAGTLAFGNLHSPHDGQTRSAFLYLDNANHAQVFHYLPAQAAIQNFYLRTHSYLTGIDDVGYILLLDGMPSVAEVRLGVEGLRELASVPKDLLNRPSFGGLPTREPRKATAVYELLEKSKMPLALYGWDGNLHVLSKEAMAEDGQTSWWLTKLDPRQDGREVARLRLPTGAAHLTIVPGSIWTMIEVGPVRGIGDAHSAFLETESVVLMPAALLEARFHAQHNTDSPLLCTELSG